MYLRSRVIPFFPPKVITGIKYTVRSPVMMKTLTRLTSTRTCDQALDLLSFLSVSR